MTDHATEHGLQQALTGLAAYFAADPAYRYTGEQVALALHRLLMAEPDLTVVVPDMLLQAPPGTLVMWGRARRIAVRADGEGDEVLTSGSLSLVPQSRWADTVHDLLTHHAGTVRVLSYPDGRL